MVAMFQKGVSYFVGTVQSSRKNRATWFFVHLWHEVLVFHLLLASKSLFLYRLFCFQSIDTAVYEWTIKTILGSIREQSFKSIPERTFFIEIAVFAVLWEVWVIVTERVSILASVVLQSPLRLCRLHVLGTDHWVISGFERTLAVPSVSWVVLIPEWIIHWKGKLHLPIGTVATLWLLGSGRHPSEVWQDVLVSLELPPVGSGMGTDHGRVVFRL